MPAVNWDSKHQADSKFKAVVAKQGMVELQG